MDVSAMAIKNNIIKDVSLSACVRGNNKDRSIKTSYDSHVLKTLLLWPAWIWAAFGRGLTCVWPGLGQGQVWARIPPLHSHIFVTAGGGEGCVI